MLPKNNYPKKTQSYDWLKFGVILIFVLVVLAGSIVFILYSTSKNAPVPTLEMIGTPTYINTATLTFTPVPQPSSTPVPSPTPQVYVVQEGDTLYSIALGFGITVDTLKAVNALSSDLIIPGQQLQIPESQILASIPTVLADTPAPAVTSAVTRYQVTEGDTLESIASTQGTDLNALRAANTMLGDTVLPGQFISIPLDAAVVFPAWRFSMTSGGLNQGYPLSVETDRFTLHYQPNTFPAQDPNILAQLEADDLKFLEALTGLNLQNKYDVYVAGTNFAPPNRALRGITFSSSLKTFFLHDGTGDVADQQYISTHELTHLFFWNTVGSPSSTMLSEGTAVYTGMERIQTSQHMPLDVFCAAYLQADALPQISGSLSFLGHIADLQNYYASGCFVKYLVDTYGIQSLKAVYHSGDYKAVYGRNLVSLEAEWRQHLASVSLPSDLDSKELVQSVNDLESSYVNFFSSFSGSASQRQAYRELDKARIALLEGNLADMHNLLTAFKAIH